MRNLTGKQQNLLDFLIALNDLEWGQDRAFRSLSGRLLYYQMAISYCHHRRQPTALKERFGKLSERAIRDRIRALETDEWVECQPGIWDTRTRKLVPTRKFFDLVQQHLTRCQKVLENHYFMIEK